MGTDKPTHTFVQSPFGPQGVKRQFSHPGRHCGVASQQKSRGRELLIRMLVNVTVEVMLGSGSNRHGVSWASKAR